jgi:hypothetical protein
MGDIAEYFTIYAEIHKQKREERKAKYEPILKQIGAVLKSDGVYMLNDWFLYPTKGFAMNRYNYRKKGLEKIIREVRDAKEIENNR